MSFHPGAALLWGFVATTVLTTVIAGSQSLRITRISLPFLLGSMFTADRDRAKLVGLVVHFVNGWLFAFIYAAAFVAWGRATWWLGALIGLVHASFVLTAGMSFLPALHPRMASERQGPTLRRQIEPPGPFGLHYGRRTPLVVLVAHALYGGILGAFYR